MRGFKNALKLFKWAAKNVPAYEDFLKKHKINPAKIKTHDDFRKIPLMEKKNYLRKYPYPELFHKKIIPPMISMSSGSSGKPFYWPRSFTQEEIGGKTHEIIYRDIFKIKGENTLAVICFSMGTWIAGVFTALCSRYVASRGYNLSVATPGIEKEDILAILKDFAPNFDEVILTGYPPFLMDVLVEARDRKISVKNLNLRLLFAGENFSEKWRSILHEFANIKNPLDGSISVYGTADAAMLGHETPLSIYIRRKAEADKKFSAALFGNASFLQTLVQYYPDQIFFETINGELVFTTNAGIPLVRYNIHDTGMLIPYEDAIKSLKRFGYYSGAQRKKLLRWKLPFLTLGGRNDVAVTFYALNIYPENIKAGLEDDRICKYFTGKFVARNKTVNRGKKQKLALALELRKKTSPTVALKTLAQNIIFENLVKLNIEYRKLYSSIGRRALPQIKFRQFGDPMFQVKKSKHQWIEKR